jgi:phytoene synthase
MSSARLELAAPERRGTPPGSMRYFAVLFAEPATRPALHACYALEAELRDTARGASHDIAHTRLEWWREELTLLVRGCPRHPVSIELGAALAHRPAELARLSELALAAALDLARSTYADWVELQEYCAHGAGALQQAIAAVLAQPAGPDEAERRFAQRLGVAVRQIEMLRDFGRDLRQGLLYLPISALTEVGLDPRSVPENPDHPALCALRARWKSRLAVELDSLPGLLDLTRRRRQAHGLVLGALHRRLLERIDAAAVSPEVRANLPPITRLWTAWRAAVASHRP